MNRILEFTSNNPLLVGALMISFFVLVFSELRRKATGLVALTPNSAVALINANATVVDLRSKEAFDRGHITNARHIPHDEFDAKKDGLDTKRPTVFVCDSGLSSNKVTTEMRAAGFESAYGLKGGMNAWTQAGLPVVTGKKTRSKGKK